jgi:cation:H+ antiporter
MLEAWVFFIGGLIALGIGGEVLVRGAVGTSQKLGLSALFVGVVVVAFGTSAPELVVSLQAAFAGTPDIAIGNVIGSNIANIGLVLAAGAVICRLPVRRIVVWRDGSVVLAGSGGLILLAAGGIIDFQAGLVLVGALLAYIVLTYTTESLSGGEVGAHEQVSEYKIEGGLGKALLFCAIGIVLLVVGANYLIDGAQTIARALGVSDAVIAVTAVALGTSLPELATVIVAAFRKQTDLMLGSILGSNAFNLFSILGIVALVHPLDVNPVYLAFDLWAMLGFVLLLLPFMLMGRSLNRWEGLILLAAYAAYIYLVATGAPDLRALFA